MFSVVARSPAVLTCEFGPKRIPFGFIMKICPLAVMSPIISEGLAPEILFRAMASALGCIYCTSSSAAME